MKLLLIGHKSSTTETVFSMLNTSTGWEIIRKTIQKEFNPEYLQSVRAHELDAIIANLADFITPPRQIIQQTTDHFLSPSLLVLYTYGRESLALPLIKAGATGYLQLGSCEDKLLEAVKQVAKGEPYLHVENTYKY